MKQIFATLLCGSMALGSTSVSAAGTGCDLALGGKHLGSACLETVQGQTHRPSGNDSVYKAIFSQRQDHTVLASNGPKNLGTWPIPSATDSRDDRRADLFVTKTVSDSSPPVTAQSSYSRALSSAMQEVGAAPTPQPATHALLLTGLIAVVYVSQRRRPRF